MTVGMGNVTLRLIVLVTMVLGALLSPAGFSTSHDPLLAMMAAPAHDEVSLDHGHRHDNDDDAGSGHSHRHNPADHSHVTAGLVGEVPVVLPRFGRDWSEHLHALVKADRPFPLERPPRSDSAA